MRKWKIFLAELEDLIALTFRAKLLDLATLPLDDKMPRLAAIEHFPRPSRLLRVRDSLAETEITLLEVLKN